MPVSDERNNLSLRRSLAISLEIDFQADFGIGARF
jgi:hypothetical protein